MEDARLLRENLGLSSAGYRHQWLLSWGDGSESEENRDIRTVTMEFKLEDSGTVARLWASTKRGWVCSPKAPLHWEVSTFLRNSLQHLLMETLASDCETV